MINLMGLAVSPQTSDAVTISGPLDDHGGPLTEPLHSAIALQPPNQSDSDLHSPSQPPIADGLSQGHTGEEAAPVTTEVVL